jgi:hypothetical protein
MTSWTSAPMEKIALGYQGIFNFAWLLHVVSTDNKRLGTPSLNKTIQLQR